MDSMDFMDGVDPGSGDSGGEGRRRRCCVGRDAAGVVGIREIVVRGDVAAPGDGRGPGRRKNLEVGGGGDMLGELLTMAEEQRQRIADDDPRYGTGQLVRRLFALAAVSRGLPVVASVPSVLVLLLGLVGLQLLGW